VRPLSCLALALAVSTGSTSGAAPQGADRPVFLSVQTDLVTLPVTVVDGHGGFVGGLVQSDFTVYDNDERRAIEFFTSEELPATVGLVVDSSGSMRSRRDAVTAAGVAFAESIHPLDELFTVNFNETVWPGLAPDIPFTRDRDQLRTALAAAPAAGMTALYDAIDCALDHVQLGTRDRKALIVVSDGGDNASAHALAEVLEHARRADVLIYAVILADPDNREANPRTLKKLARETGGEAFTARHPAEVTTRFAQVAREIRSGYTLGFLPAETADAGYRTIRVVANPGDRRQLIVRTRAGYYAGSSGRAPR
jgi:VWFA-related protein